MFLVILQKRIAGLTRSTLERFVLQARRAAGLRDAVHVLITGSRELRSLNRRFLGKDRPTDVLSFPSQPSGRATRCAAGEVAISAEVARRNARRLGHSVADEVKILVLHGILHLAGYDHEHDDGRMAGKENQLRQQLKLESGLIERTQARACKAAREQRRDPSSTAGRRRTA